MSFEKELYNRLNNLCEGIIKDVDRKGYCDVELVKYAVTDFAIEFARKCVPVLEQPPRYINKTGIAVSFMSEEMLDGFSLCQKQIISNIDRLGYTIDFLGDVIKELEK